jgi:sugar phosphate isomerase/epimerase
MAAVTTPALLFSTAAFFDRPLREALGTISEAGYAGVEVMVTRDPATQDAAVVRDLAAEHGLSVAAIHAPFLLLSRRVWTTDPVTKIYRALQMAEHVGAGLVVIHPPYRWQRRYRRWVERSLGDLAAATGVTIGVENMFPLRLPSERGMRFHAPSQELRDLERFPAVVLDTSHAAVAGLDLLEAVDRLRDRLVHVHLSDNAGKGWDSHLPIGEGVLPLGPLLDRLASDGFAGSLSLELDLRRYADDRAALLAVMREARRFCEDRLPLSA